jgi:hypothetical protein
MRPPNPPDGKCPSQKEQCKLICKYNHFEADDLTIDSWELKCLDCGYRNTIAYRSDDSDLDLENCDPQRCPFCKLTGLSTGQNPCESASAQV